VTIADTKSILRSRPQSKRVIRVPAHNPNELGGSLEVPDGAVIIPSTVKLSVGVGATGGGDTFEGSDVDFSMPQKRRGSLPKRSRSRRCGWIGKSETHALQKALLQMPGSASQ
jgi:hypothetical protein